MERTFAQSNSTVCEPVQGLGEVWELSTRHYPDRFRSLPPGSLPIRPYKHSPGIGWELDSLENALVDDGRLTILYVHGNFMERNNARDRVLIVNRYLQAKAKVTGGLHFASGGSVPGFSSPLLYPASNQLSSYRVAFVAPAVDRNWIAQGGKHALALDRVDGLINLYNSRDPILRRFRFIDRFSSPVAAGFAGFLGGPGLESIGAPRATQPLNASKRIEQYDCGGLIGTTHSERSYYGECPYFGKVVDHLLWNDSPIANTSTANTSTATDLIDTDVIDNDANAISNHD